MSTCIFKTRLDKYQQHLDDYLENHKDDDELANDPIFRKLEHKVNKYRYFSQREEVGRDSDSDSDSDHSLSCESDDSLSSDSDDNVSSCSDDNVSSDSDDSLSNDNELAKLEQLVSGFLGEGGDTVYDQTAGFITFGNSDATNAMKEKVKNKKGMLQGNLYKPILEFLRSYKDSREKKGRKETYTKSACRNVRKLLKKRGYLNGVSNKLKKILYKSQTFTSDRTGTAKQRSVYQTQCENNGLQTVFKICVMDQILGRLLDFMMKPLNLIERKHLDVNQVKMIDHLSQNTDHQADQFFMTLQQVVHKQSLETGYHTGRDLPLVVNIPPSTFQRIHETISHTKYPGPYTQIINTAIQHVKSAPNYDPDERIDLIRQLEHSISRLGRFAPGQFARASIIYEGPAPQDPQNKSKVRISLQSLQQSDYAATDTRRKALGLTTTKRALRERDLMHDNKSAAIQAEQALREERHKIEQEIAAQPLHSTLGRQMIFDTLHNQVTVLTNRLKEDSMKSKMNKAEIDRINNEIAMKKQTLININKLPPEDRDHLTSHTQELIDKNERDLEPLKETQDNLLAERKQYARALRDAKGFLDDYDGKIDDTTVQTHPELVLAAEQQLRNIERKHPDDLLELTTTRDKFRDKLRKQGEQHRKALHSRQNQQLTFGREQAQANVNHQKDHQQHVRTAAERAYHSGRQQFSHSGAASYQNELDNYNSRKAAQTRQTNQTGQIRPYISPYT